MALVATILSAACTTTYRMAQAPAAGAGATLEQGDPSILRREAAGQGVTLLHGSIRGRARFEPALIPATDPAAAAQGPALLAPPDVIGYEMKRHGLGAVEGLGLGVLTGVVAGVMVGAALGDDVPCTGDGCAGIAFSAGEKALAGALVAGCAGALLGTFIGALVGHTDRVVF